MNAGANGHGFIVARCRAEWQPREVSREFASVARDLACIPAYLLRYEDGFHKGTRGAHPAVRDFAGLDRAWPGLGLRGSRVYRR
jgi:hypothetical protein